MLIQPLKPKEFKMKKISIVCLFIMVLSVNNLHSEYSKTTRYLGNEPLTTFELGMYRLGILVDETMEITKGGSDENEEEDNSIKIFDHIKSEVVYDWGKNRIFINIIFVIEDGDLSTSRKKEIFRDYTELIKMWVNLHNIDSFFDYSGYGKTDRSEKITENIKDITSIRMMITPSLLPNKSFKYYLNLTQKIVMSESPLVGDEIFFKENTDDKK
jgi:hypothetical protein